VIRMRGNESLHSAPGALDAVGGPLGIVRRLATCLREMTAVPPSNRPT
jgi:hypothetical protein